MTIITVAIMAFALVVAFLALCAVIAGAHADRDWENRGGGE